MENTLFIIAVASAALCLCLCVCAACIACRHTKTSRRETTTTDAQALQLGSEREAELEPLKSRDLDSPAPGNDLMKEDGAQQMAALDAVELDDGDADEKQQWIGERHHTISTKLVRAHLQDDSMDDDEDEEMYVNVSPTVTPHSLTKGAV